MGHAREKNAIYLIGHESTKLHGSDFPSNKQVLRLFFHKHKSLNLTIRKSALATIKEVEDVWRPTQVPMRRTQHSATKLEKLYKLWKNLQKSRLRKNSRKQKIKEKAFQSSLANLFDIAHDKALHMIRSRKTREFFMEQRRKRRRESESFDSENDEVNSPESSQPLSADTVLTEEGLSTDRNFEDETPGPSKPKKTKIMSESLASALDRTKTSSRSATHIVAAVASSLGHDIDTINLSYSAIHRNRSKRRVLISSEVKESVQTPKGLVVHWDGKLLPDLTGKETVERLPIVLSGSGSEQLLGVPKITSATGANQAAIIVQTLNAWNLTDRVSAMCFDTTSSNTGRFNGACTLIENTLGRSLIHLPCRHHVFELILRSVVEIYWPTTTGPNVPIFKRFQQAWDGIDTSRYNTGLSDNIVAEVLNDKKDEILAFIFQQLETSQPRDDYREFLELACIFLNGTPPRQVRFRIPGAMHHARWMAKAIYCLKIFLFKSQFTLTARETNALRDICIFIVAFYVQAWFRAPSAIAAPYHDLQLLQNLIQYERINAKVSKAARNKLALHLWYISEDLIGLAFFDASVPLEVKEKMRQAVRCRDSVTNCTKRVIVQEGNLLSWTDKDVADFTTKKSLVLFERFNLPHDFLSKNPEQWSSDLSFQRCAQFFTHMKVVNDIAERGVALIEAYNGCLTRNEEQMQYLLQVVQEHRKKYPNCNKVTLSTV